MGKTFITFQSYPDFHILVKQLVLQRALSPWLCVGIAQELTGNSHAGPGLYFFLSYSLSNTMLQHFHFLQKNHTLVPDFSVHQDYSAPPAPVWNAFLERSQSKQTYHWPSVFSFFKDEILCCLLSNVWKQLLQILSSFMVVYGEKARLVSVT